MHRDLKSANVFLYSDLTAKLGDLNVSKIAKMGLNYTQTGTPYYASPEVWKEQPYDLKSDVWSLGCVIYEMLTLKPPFRAQNMKELYKKVLRGNYPRVPSTFSGELSRTISSMIQVNPKSRPTCAELLSKDYVMDKLQAYFPEEFKEGENTLLNTIKVPMNLHYLTDRLPKADYERGKSQPAFAKRKKTREDLFRNLASPGGNK